MPRVAANAAKQTDAPIRARVIPHKEFARRMHQACDGNRDVPQPNFGRLQWFVDQLQERFNLNSSPETIRKWFAGEALPRHKSMHALAEILKVDEAWLAIGKQPELDARAQKLRDATVDGAVNVVAGFVQMHGANPAFPAPNDKRAAAEHIDLYAVIRGVNYSFHVSVASEADKGWKFVIPTEAENTLILGVVPTGDTAIEIIEIDPEGLSEGERKGGYVELRMSASYKTDRHQFKRVSNFRERL